MVLRSDKTDKRTDYIFVYLLKRKRKKQQEKIDGYEKKNEKQIIEKNDCIRGTEIVYEFCYALTSHLLLLSITAIIRIGNAVVAAVVVVSVVSFCMMMTTHHFDMI